MAQQGTQVLDTRPGRLPTAPVAGRPVLGVVLLAAAVMAAVIVGVAASGQPAASATVRQPPAGISVLAGSPTAASASTARALLTAAPSLVVASAASPSAVSTAGAIAVRAHAPMLLLPAIATPAEMATLRGTITGLHPSAVLAIGVARRSVTSALAGVHVVARASALPVMTPAVPMHAVAVLVRTGGSASEQALATAATATARAAGARVIDLPGYDPRADEAAIAVLAASRPSRVVAVGAGFGSAGLLAGRVAVAETGVQLPGGGQVLFPAHRIVALYGAPGTPALGVLGHQPLAASIARAKATAAQYARLSKVPVIASFEIIATVAEASPGPSGTYSFESSVKSLRPWVTAASRAGMYVTLDLQPGRASLLAQAKRYRSLLELPNVGLALDPEWALKPGELPLHQIGSISAAAVNRVTSWLAALTARYHLPQKLLELHEFRLSMIQGIQRLDTRHDDLAIVINMDGQGAPRVKMMTWRAVIAHAPKGVFFGWKDFYAKDTPMLSPVRTLRHYPEPVLISYQ